jgi:benzoylformate decarboxylase
MYSIQALWAAAHHNLPLTVVLVNNGGYRIIKQRLLAFHQDNHFVGMDFKDPPVDFTALAKALGVEAVRVHAGKESPSILASAVNRQGPRLIEVITDGSVVA